jgi:hypothetical protein
MRKRKGERETVRESERMGYRERKEKIEIRIGGRESKM